MLANKNGYRFGRARFLSGVIGAIALICSESLAATQPKTLDWQSKARLHGLLTSSRGDLLISNNAIEFRPVKGTPLSWSFADPNSTDIKSFRIAPQRLILVSYQNKSWHRGGDREFRFDMDTPVPIDVAADMVKRIGKPSINGIPDPQMPAVATIPARRRTFTGGSNGVLRLRETGIDYVASASEESRSWRWVDIETLANPDPYHFRVSAYLETFEFELKQPMSQQFFDRLWSDLYAHGFNINAAATDANSPVEIEVSGRKEQR